jgi:hypothetical protein
MPLNSKASMGEVQDFSNIGSETPGWLLIVAAL